MPSDSERQFLEAYDPAEFPRPSVAVDVVLLAPGEASLETVLIRRHEHPYAGTWTLPGGFVGPAEALDAAAARVLKQKAGLGGLFLEQLYTFGAPQRDPRTRVISVAYYALVEPARFAAVRSATDVRVARIDVPWAGEAGGAVRALDDEGRALRIGFDHAQMLGLAIKRIRGKLAYAPLAYELLPRAFTLSQLQRVHEIVLGTPLNKDSFRRRILASGEVVDTGRVQGDVDHRPAALYRFHKGGRHG